MKVEEYQAQQAVISAAVAAYVSRFSSFFLIPKLSVAQWLDLLRLLFPEVQQRYRQSAELARRFYDSERRSRRPDLPRHDMYRGELEFEQFVQNMDVARAAVSQPGANRSAITKLSLAAVREVEMGGRRQMLAAVYSDPILTGEQPSPDTEDLDQNRELMQKLNRVVNRNDRADSVVYIESAGRDDIRRYLRQDEPEPELEAVEELDYRSDDVIGWARVATGSETCAWCLMLISRGAEFPGKDTPFYIEAATAGLNLDDGTAISIWNEVGGSLEAFREATKEDFEQWHAGCDCLVVPVFDVKDWPGKSSAQRAQELWIDAAKEANQLIADGEARTKNKHKETLNALRRRLDRGEIDPYEYAVAA